MRNAVAAAVHSTISSVKSLVDIDDPNSSSLACSPGRTRVGCVLRAFHQHKNEAQGEKRMLLRCLFFIRRVLQLYSLGCRKHPGLVCRLGHSIEGRWQPASCAHHACVLQTSKQEVVARVPEGGMPSPNPLCPITYFHSCLQCANDHMM